MKRYEYAELVNIMGKSNKKDYPYCEFVGLEGSKEIKGTVIQCLNAVGREGWRVISQIKQIDGYSIIRFYLEREIND